MPVQNLLLDTPAIICPSSVHYPSSPRPAGPSTMIIQRSLTSTTPSFVQAVSARVVAPDQSASWVRQARSAGRGGPCRLYLQELAPLLAWSCSPQKAITGPGTLAVLVPRLSRAAGPAATWRHQRRSTRSIPTGLTRSEEQTVSVEGKSWC